MSRPRTTAVWQMAGGGPPSRVAVNSSAAQRNSLRRPRIITASRNELTSRRRPKPAELISRIRLNASPASFFSTSSMASVVAWVRNRLISSMMWAWAGGSSWVCTSDGRANR